MSRMHVMGIEVSEGVSKKANVGAYSIGTLHVMIELAPARGTDNVNKGFAGLAMRCDVPILRKLTSLPFPFVAEVATKRVMQFGEPVELVIDVTPVITDRKAA